jgi:hypothetical protein
MRFPSLEHAVGVLNPPKADAHRMLGTEREGR